MGRMSLCTAILQLRCRAKMAHIRQARPDSGLGFQAKVSLSLSLSRPLSLALYLALSTWLPRGWRTSVRWMSLWIGILSSAASILYPARCSTFDEEVALLRVGRAISAHVRLATAADQVTRVRAKRQ